MQGSWSFMMVWSGGPVIDFADCRVIEFPNLAAAGKAVTVPFQNSCGTCAFVFLRSHTEGSPTCTEDGISFAGKVG